MAIIDIQGGPITRKYLEKKSKFDLITEYLHLLEVINTSADKAAPVGDAGNADCSLSVAYEDGYQKGMKDARKRSAPVERIEGLNEAITYVETDRCFAVNDDGSKKLSSRSYELGCLVRAARAQLKLQGG